MPDHSRQVETEFTLADKVTAPLSKIHQGAARVTSAFDRASGMIGKFGGIAAAAAGGFAVASSIAGAKNYLQTVQEISDAFGFQARQVDSVLEAMHTVNIQASEGRQVMEQMSLAMARTRMEVQRTGVASSDAGRIITKLGISLEKGPQNALVTMAKLAHANKLSMADLNIAFQVPQQTATKLITLLKQGPGEVSKIMTELQRRGLAVNAQNVAAFKEYQSAQLRMKSAWDRIWIVVSSRVMPVIAGLMNNVADRFDDWSTKAGDWGEKIAGFLQNHLDTVIRIGKVMLANFALQKLMGFGIGGAAQRIGGAAGRMVGLGGKAAAAVGAGGAAAAAGGTDLVKLGETISSAITASMSKFVAPVGKMANAATRYMDPGSLAAGVKKGVSTWSPPIRIPKSAPVPSGVLAKISGVFSKFAPARMPVIGKISGLFGKMLPVVGRFALVAGKFALVGAIITAVVGVLMFAYSNIKTQFDLFKGEALGLWTQLQARTQVIWGLVSPVFNKIGSLFSANGPVGYFFTAVLLTTINMLGKAVDNTLLMIQTIIIMVKKVIASPFAALKAPMDTFFTSMWEAQKLTARKTEEMKLKMLEPKLEPIPGGKVPSTRQQAPQFNFPNARFDIKQMFAEGFDPDRIAVAFSNDLAALGEKRVQSGLAPLFAVR